MPWSPPIFNYVDEHAVCGNPLMMPQSVIAFCSDNRGTSPHTVQPGNIPTGGLLSEWKLWSHLVIWLICIKALCWKDVFRSVHSKIKEKHILGGIIVGKAEGHASCSYMFMTNDRQMPLDNNWHVYKRSLIGDPKPIRPVRQVWTYQHGTYTHTHTQAYFKPHFRLCVWTQHK